MGGAERVILKIAERYNAPIYTLEHTPAKTFKEFGSLDVKIVGRDVPLSTMLPYRASQGLRYGYNFYNLKIKEDYDVINAHISPSEWIRHRNPRVLWYCHTPPREVYDLYHTRMRQRSFREKALYATMTKVYKMIAKKVVSNIEEIATNSNTTNTRIEKYFSRTAKVVNPGIDYEKFYSSSDEKFFFYPSRILENKRQEYVINAFKRFSKSSKGKGYSLVLTGVLSMDPEHMAYYTKLKRLAKGFNISIIRNASEKELLKLYSECTAVLSAAMNEDYGYVPLEAMASSKPIISVNEGGPRETIINNKTGFLVNSEEEMAAKMSFIAEHSNMAEKMGREGRKHIIKDYSWSAFFKKLDPLLKQVSKSSG